MSEPPEIMYYEGELEFPRKTPCWFLHDWEHIRTIAKPPGLTTVNLTFVYRCRKCGTTK